MLRQDPIGSQVPPQITPDIAASQSKISGDSSPYAKRPKKRFLFRCDLKPWENDEILPFIQIISPVNQYARMGNRRPQRHKITETVKKGAAYRCSGFGFQRNQLFARIDQDVHFVARPIPPEIKWRRFTTMGKGLEEFGNHIRFKDSPSQGVIGQIGRLADTEEIAQQTGIEKIEFWTLDDSFGEIDEVRRQ